MTCSRRTLLPILTVLLLLPFLAACLPMNDKPKVVILYPDDFEGLQVEIDGKVAGVLKKFGANTRTAFLVSKGDHTIRVLHPQLGSRPMPFTAVSVALPVTFLLEVSDAIGGDGKPAAELVLRH